MQHDCIKWSTKSSLGGQPSDSLSGTLQSVVLLAPAPGEGDIDEGGLTALAVLRAMGLPQLVSLVPTAPAGLQAKAAAKKHASAQLSAQVRA